MLDYKEVWKNLVNSKLATSRDCFQYTIIKAIKSKSVSKTEIAYQMLKKAFPPYVNKNRLAFSSLKGYDTLHNLIRENTRMAEKMCVITKPHFRGWLLGQDVESILDESEITLYRDILLKLRRKDLRKESRYMYIFVRQDMTPEYQAVQACHAAFVSGATFKVENPEEVNFVLIGVKTKEDLIKIAEECKENFIEYREFIEPDMNLEVTALATQTIMKTSKRIFNNYSTLKF